MRTSPQSHLSPGKQVLVSVGHVIVIYTSLLIWRRAFSLAELWLSSGAVRRGENKIMKSHAPFSSKTGGNQSNQFPAGKWKSARVAVSRDLCAWFLRTVTRHYAPWGHGTIHMLGQILLPWWSCMEFCQRIAPALTCATAKTRHETSPKTCCEA